MIINIEMDAELANKLLGAYIHKIRIEENHNGTITAEYAGIKKSYLSAIENGKVKISQQIARRIFDYFEVDFIEDIEVYQKVRSWLFEIYEDILKNDTLELIKKREVFLDNKSKIENSYAFVLSNIVEALLLMADHQELNDDILNQMQEYREYYDLQVMLVYYNIMLSSTKDIKRFVKGKEEVETITFILMQQVESDHISGISYFNLARLYSNFQKNRQALDFLVMAEKKFDHCGNVSFKVECLIEQGKLYNHLYHFMESKECLYRAYSIICNQHLPMEIKCLDALIQVHLCLEEFEQALTYIQQVEHSQLEYHYFYLLYIRIFHQGFNLLEEDSEQIEAKILRCILHHEDQMLKSLLEQAFNDFNELDNDHRYLLYKAIAHYFEDKQPEISCNYYKKIIAMVSKYE